MWRADDGPGGVRRLLLAVLAFGLAMDLVTLGITVHTRTAHPQVAPHDYLGEAAIGGVFLFALTLLLVLRRPEHPVTWALLASGFSCHSGSANGFLDSAGISD